jgi:acylphosphatase
MSELAALRAIVRGRVQGVFFRESTRRQAEQFGLSGYVRNLPDRATVEVVAEGEKARLEGLVKFLRVGPPAARVDSVETEWSSYSGKHTDFSIR